MLGRSHLLVGGAGFLAVGVPLLAAGGQSLSAAEIAAGTVVCSGAAMLPDLDHPQATVARSLGPVTELIARVVAKLFGGHRNGTHSLAFATAITALLAWQLGSHPGPWLALAICFFFSSLVVRVLTEASGAVSAALAALVAATLVTIAPSQPWLYLSVGLGCLLHMVGDILTPEGVPPLWPVSKTRISLPVIGRTGDWREWLIGSACGLALCWMLATTVFLPGFRAQADAASRTPTLQPTPKQPTPKQHAPKRPQPRPAHKN